jgi:hypothetical protein
VRDKQIPIGVVSKPVKQMITEQKYYMKTADPENQNGHNLLR